MYRRCFFLLLLFSLVTSRTTLATGISQVNSDPHERIINIANRILKGESVTPEEKKATSPYLERIHRSQKHTLPPRINYSGGPDAFGYRFIGSNDPEGPYFNWIEPTSGATVVTAWTNIDDGHAGPFDIGFSFPFYGIDYTQFYPGTNGRIEFGGSYDQSYGANSFPLAQDEAGIFFWQQDLIVLDNSVSVRYETTMDNRLVITYDSIPEYLHHENRISAQVILSQSGEIICQYRNFAGGPSANAVGIQNQHGQIYLAYSQISSQYPIFPGTAIRFYQLGYATNPIPADNATSVTTNLTLSWSAALGATGYDVHLDVVNPPADMVSQNQPGLSYTPSFIDTMTTYYWQIVARNATNTELSPVWAFTTGSGNAPVAPSTSQTPISNPTTNSMIVNWVDNSTDETGFPITHSTDGANFYLSATAPANTNSYSVQTILTPNTRHWFHIYASNIHATSMGYASADGWTLPVLPGVMTAHVANYHTIAIDNIAANGNPPNTLYSIATDTGWIRLDSTIIRRTAAGWANFQWSVASNTTFHLHPVVHGGNGLDYSGNQITTVTTPDIDQGGPYNGTANSYPYYFVTSREAGEVGLYNFVDISQSGTLVERFADGSTHYDTTTISLGTFRFPMFGTVYDGSTICLTATGTIQFTTNLGSTYYENTNLPTSHFNCPTIAFLWDDNFIQWPNSWVRYEDMGDGRFVIQYRINHYTGSTVINCEVILYSDGRIICQYDPSGGNSGEWSATVGIQATPASPLTQTPFVQYADSTFQPSSPPFAIEFLPLMAATNIYPSDSAQSIPTSNTFRWTPVTGVSGYDVYLSTTNPPNSIVWSNGYTNSWQPTTPLSLSTTYYWRVVSRRTRPSLGTYSSPVWSFRTYSGFPPVAPSNGSVSHATTTGMEFDWVDNSVDETAFVVRRSNDGYQFSVIGSTPANTRYYIDNSLSPNTEWWYRVYAINSAGSNPGFAYAHGFTLAVTPGLPVLSSLDATSENCNFINCINGNSPETEYQIGINTLFIQAGGFPGSTPIWQSATDWGEQFTIRGLYPERTYYLSITARNRDHIQSQTLLGVNFTTPSLVTGLHFAAYPVNRRVVLRWHADSENGVNSYRVERVVLIPSSEPTDTTWTVVGTVQSNSHGSHTTPVDYYITDENLTNDISYHYRLIVVSQSGIEMAKSETQSTPTAPIIANYELNAYPNPFNATMRISYTFKATDKVLIRIFNLKGEIVTILLDDDVNAGTHTLDWNAHDKPSGIYILELSSKNYHSIRKIVLAK